MFTTNKYPKPAENKRYRKNTQPRNSTLQYIRNILNATFILLAIAAMAFISYSWINSNMTTKYIGIVLGFVGVFIKMGESVLRMICSMQNFSQKKCTK